MTGICYDCCKKLYKGEGKYEPRKGAWGAEKKRMVCRDREECARTRASWVSAFNARQDADNAAATARIEAMSDEEQRTMLLDPSTVGEW